MAILDKIGHGQDARGERFLRTGKNTFGLRPEAL
jgi:hypothetical protein